VAVETLLLSSATDCLWSAFAGRCYSDATNAVVDTVEDETEDNYDGRGYWLYQRLRSDVLRREDTSKQSRCPR
jgi:hypothetical protein